MNDLFSGKTIDHVEHIEDFDSDCEEVIFFFTDGTKVKLYSGGSVDSFGNVRSYISEC